MRCVVDINQISNHIRLLKKELVKVQNLSNSITQWKKHSRNQVLEEQLNRIADVQASIQKRIVLLESAVYQFTRAKNMATVQLNVALQLLHTDQET